MFIISMIINKRHMKEQQEQINMHGYLIIRGVVQQMDVMWLILVLMDTGQQLHISEFLPQLGTCTAMAS